MEHTFKKGDAVNVLVDWDNKGTVKIYRGTIQSCGRKVMRITFSNAPQWNRHNYTPGTTKQPQHSRLVLPLHVDAELRAFEFAREIIAREHDRLSRCIDRRDAMPNYIAAIIKHRSEIHAPEVIHADA